MIYAPLAERSRLRRAEPRRFDHWRRDRETGRPVSPVAGGIRDGSICSEGPLDAVAGAGLRNAPCAGAVASRAQELQPDPKSLLRMPRMLMPSGRNMGRLLVDLPYVVWFTQQGFAEGSPQTALYGWASAVRKPASGGS
jgi:hypothetical protein